MEDSITIRVPSYRLLAFKDAVKIGNIPLSVYNPIPSEVYYITIIYDEESYQFTGLKGATEPTNIKDVCFYYEDTSYFRLPTEIQKDIVSRTKQYNCIGFLIDIMADKASGGFDWEESAEGYEWWREVLVGEKYELYFDKYPRHFIKCGKGLLDQINGTWEYEAFSKAKLDNVIDKTVHDSLYKKYEECIKDYSETIEEKLKQYLNDKENESRLQEQEADLSGRDSGKPIRVCNRGNKARVAKFSLSYKKVLGRS